MVSWILWRGRTRRPTCSSACCLQTCAATARRRGVCSYASRSWRQSRGESCCPRAVWYHPWCCGVRHPGQEGRRRCRQGGERNHHGRTGRHPRCGARRYQSAAWCRHRCGALRHRRGSPHPSRCPYGQRTTPSQHRTGPRHRAHRSASPTSTTHPRAQPNPTPSGNHHGTATQTGHRPASTWSRECG